LPALVTSIPASTPLNSEPESHSNAGIGAKCW
jgi:hypothetical protein